MNGRHLVIVDATAAPVHYVHFRSLLERVIEVDGKKQVAYDFESYGGATLAYIEVEDEGQQTIYAALAQCHEYDRFVKRLGRDHARGRLQQALIRHFKGVDGSFYTTGLDKIYVLPGPANVVLNELIEEIESGTGYIASR